MNKISRKAVIISITCILIVALGSTITLFAINDGGKVTNAQKCQEQTAIRNTPPYPDVAFAVDYCSYPPNEAAQE